MDSKVVTKVGPIQSWGRCWALVTGASAGIGAGICEKLAKEFPPNSVIVGIGRNKDGLQRTENNVKKLNGELKFIPYCLDLESATAKDYLSMISTVFEQLDKMEFDRFVIMHNAGTLGELNYLTNITDTEQINKYFASNLSSLISLNGCLLSLIKKLPTKPSINIINISSLAAIQPIKSWGLYCIGKAARNMAMSILATEETDINVLNYAPGAVETHMQVQARNDTCDVEVRGMFNNMRNEGKLVKMEDSIHKLICTLKKGNYKSGSHVDYFDEI